MVCLGGSLPGEFTKWKDREKTVARYHGRGKRPASMSLQQDMQTSSACGDTNSVPLVDSTAHLKLVVLSTGVLCPRTVRGVCPCLSGIAENGP